MATTSVDIFRGTLKKMEKEFSLVLPKGVTPETFTRVVMTAVQSEPSLLPHLNTDAGQKAMIGAAMKCAQDGLMPDKREAAFVVYNGQPQYMPMIGGVRKKLMATGLFNGVPAHVVYENDFFDYELGDNERLEHRPVLKDRGEPIAAYAIAIFKDGYREREVMPYEDIEKVRAVSAAKNGPWAKWWDQMAIKTVTKRLAKRLPGVGREVLDMLDADKAEFGGATYDVAATPVDTSEFDRLAAEHNPDMDALSRFVAATAHGNGCSVDELKAQAVADFDGFWSMFESWQVKNAPRKRAKGAPAVEAKAAKATQEAANAPIPETYAGECEPTSAPKTVPCPNLLHEDGVTLMDVLVTKCAGCKDRPNCPSWANEAA